MTNLATIAQETAAAHPDRIHARRRDGLLTLTLRLRDSDVLRATFYPALPSPPPVLVERAVHVGGQDMRAAWDIATTEALQEVLPDWLDFDWHGFTFSDDVAAAYRAWRRVLADHIARAGGRLW